MARSEKMYKSSPSIERDAETGKPGIKRPTKATSEDIGLEGNPLPEDTGGGMPINVHQKSRLREARHRHITEHLAQIHRHDAEAEGADGEPDLMQRYVDEHKEMSSRHQKELEAMIKTDSKDKE